MKKKKVLIGIIALVAMISFSACQSKSVKEEVERLDLSTATWEEIENQANGKDVAMYMWGGSEVVNHYMDDYVLPEVKDKYNINLKRIPITDISDTINQILAEKEIQKENGSADILWINGENFKNAKENKLLWGNIVDKLPNYENYFDKTATSNTLDFGLETEGYEAPWGQAQFVFTYNTKYITNPPKSIEELEAFVKENPGKFTYPAPPDFTGSAFVRTVIYETTGGYEDYLIDLTREEFESKIEAAWDYLKRIKPYLWREGITYPESSGKLDQMYANEEVWMTLSYNPLHSAAMIKSGQFPDTTKTFVLDSGSLTNTHFLSIPYNSKEREGALVVINFLMSPQAQIRKMDPNHWGDQMVLDPSKISDEDHKIYENLDLGQSTLSLDVLKEHSIPEMKGRYIQYVENKWTDNIVKD